MPSLKEIKTRIASVNSTRKITSAMKMVASSKLHHAQVAIQNMLPYENLLEHILKSFLVSMPETGTIYEMEHAQTKRVALIVFSSNSSLCGGFNTNVVKMMREVGNEYKAQGVDVLVYPIGRKVEEKVEKLGFTKAGSYLDLAEKPDAAQCADIMREVGQKFLHGEVDRIELIYHHFKSAGSQILTRKTLLPIDLSTEAIGEDNDRDLTSNVATAKAQEYLRKRKERDDEERQTVKGVKLNDDFIVEPDLKTVLYALVPKLLRLMVYTALLDSVASEHAARMVAMQTATDNADELLRELNLEYNKSRQAAITNELLDIVGGSVNN